MACIYNMGMVKTASVLSPVTIDIEHDNA